MGVLLTVVVIVGVGAIMLAFTGHFTSVVHFRAEVSGQGNAVQVGSAVQYRNVTVGKVVSQSPGPGGRVALKLDIYPAKLRSIPPGVTASVSPLSIFGNQYVELHAPATIAPGHLRGGQFIPADEAALSDSLQGTVSQLYNLLNAVHPADLDTALTALATALRGQGSDLGHALVSASRYFGGLVPSLPALNSDLTLLSPVSSNLAASAPNLVGILGNSEVTGSTISSQAATLHQFLTGGAGLAGQTTSLVRQIQDTYPTLVNEASPILADMSANPDELSQTLTGLGKWAAAWAAAETKGPFVSLQTTLPIANINAAVQASLGYDATNQIALGLGSAVNPPTYTSSDCPQYPGESNPYCGVGGSPAANPAPTKVNTAGTSKPMVPAQDPPPVATQSAAPAPPGADPAEQQALQTIASGLDQGSANQGVTTLLLYSLFSSLTPGA